MVDKRHAYRLRVINSYLIIAFTYLAVMMPIFFFVLDSRVLQAVHILDLAVCIWAVIYLRRTNNFDPPAVAICCVAYLTVLAVIVTGGYASTGPYLVFPYIPLVAFLSKNWRGAMFWMLVMLVTLLALLGLNVNGWVELPMANNAFVIYIFTYFLTVALLGLYMYEKELADQAVVRQSIKLGQSNRKLRQLNEAKDSFIHLASHQLRTPATGVKQYLGILLDGYQGALTKQQRQFVKTGYDINERQLKIVDDLLSVAKIDAGKIKLRRVPTDLRQMADQVVNEQKAVFRKRRQKVVKDFNKDDVVVNCDDQRLHMALSNIVDNASKYSNKGGQITVKVWSRAGLAGVAVTDNGVGISKQDRAKLFKKFSRIDNPMSIEVGGSGLGLYWAKKIVELHKGKLLVRTRPGKGSTFEIRLPLD